MSQKLSNPHYPNFDLIRVFLALLVVYDHSLALTSTDWWHPPIMAVPAFLAISGFLVLGSYEFSSSWGNFVWKRALRIGPALIGSFIVCLLLIGPGSVKSSLIIWITGGLVYPEGPKNFALWSLAWEELAYLMLVILWGAGAYRRRIYIWLLLLASLIFTWWCSDLPPNHKIITFLLPAFFVGNLAYMHKRELMSVHPAIPWLVFFLLLQWWQTSAAQLFGGAALAVVQAFAMVWVGIAGTKIIPFKFPDISYGAYVYHLPILFFIVGRGWADNAVTTLVLLVPSLLFVCLISWYAVEKPALRMKKWRPSFRAVPAE